MAVYFKSMEGYTQGYDLTESGWMKQHSLNKKNTIILLKKTMCLCDGSGDYVNPPMHLGEPIDPRAPTMNPGTVVHGSFIRPRYLSWSLNHSNSYASGHNHGLSDSVEMAAKHVYQPELPKYSSQQTSLKLPEALRENNAFLLKEALKHYFPPGYVPCPKAVDYGELSSCGTLIKNQKIICSTCCGHINSKINFKPFTSTISEPSRPLALQHMNRVILQSYNSNYRSPFRFLGIRCSFRLQRAILRIKSKLRSGWDYKRRMGGRKFGFPSIKREPYSTVSFEQSSEDNYYPETLESLVLESEITLVFRDKEDILHLIMPTMKDVLASLLSQYADAPQEEYERAASDLVMDICLNKDDFFSLVPRWEFLELCADLSEGFLQEVLWDCMLEGRKVVDEYRSCNGIEDDIYHLEIDLKDGNDSEGHVSFEDQREAVVQAAYLSDAEDCSSNESKCEEAEKLTEELDNSIDDISDGTGEEVDDADESERCAEKAHSTHEHSDNPWIEPTYKLDLELYRAEDSNKDIGTDEVAQELSEAELRSSEVPSESIGGISVRLVSFVPEIEHKKEIQTDSPLVAECNESLVTDNEVSNVPNHPNPDNHPLESAIQHTGQDLTNYKSPEVCDNSRKMAIRSDVTCALPPFKDKEYNTGESNETQGTFNEPLPVPPASTFKKTIPGKRIRNIVNQFDSTAEIIGLGLNPGG